ncbi:MAG: hypothetical protein RMI79_04525 [Nitrososphaerota archaeon]|nr:hypothetical protein [Nitrososphaerota archaeon]
MSKLLVIVSESPWPMFKHDPQHIGESPYPGIREAKLYYSTDGLVYPSPVIGADGTLYLWSMISTSMRLILRYFKVEI